MRNLGWFASRLLKIYIDIGVKNGDSEVAVDAIPKTTSDEKHLTAESTTVGDKNGSETKKD